MKEWAKPIVEEIKAEKTAAGLSGVNDGQGGLSS